MSAVHDLKPQQFYAETRQHEVHKMRMMMVDGNLTTNARTTESGVSARALRDGYWGFAAAPVADAATLQRVENKAMSNADAMSRFGKRNALSLPSATHIGEQVFEGRSPWTPKQCNELLSELHEWCKSTFPQLRSTRFILHDEKHIKHLKNSLGSDVISRIDRAAVYMMMIAEGDDGAPIELMEILSCRGSIADLELTVDALKPKLHTLYDHLQAKRHAVPARAGTQQVIIAPELAGMLAHEAMGHPCEADLVLGGSVAGDLVGKKIASDKITMIDYAHSQNGQSLMIPVIADDEGTPSRDAVLIENGVLRQFMGSRETAAKLGIENSGSARAYAPADEPLVRMRNTAILPGSDKLNDMIADIEDGYLLLKTGNGQADSTTEFMFGISLGYEIRNGQLGPAIRDTTVSGSALKVLSAVDAVSDDMHWECNGYCGKKQPMIVSLGGPALRTRLHMGGE